LEREIAFRRVPAPLASARLFHIALSERRMTAKFPRETAMANSRTVVVLSANASVEPPLNRSTRFRVGSTVEITLSRELATSELRAPTAAERVR
jgi:hypothetical protein